ncbi:MAG TPA: choice-of-anchor Q domain-containing protein [Tepidisphaeraceae bacterium]|nr:choice-of-anchor Q domain-containing protein [Tepidisphaeraceae bacterium]
MRSTIEPLECRTLFTTVVVNTAVDTLTPGSGLTSLREAVSIANSSTSATTITFDPTAFVSATTIVQNGTTYLLTNATYPTTIIGAPAGLTLDGAGESTVFHLNTGVTLTISDLTISNGYDGDSQGGGGIDSFGNLNLTGVTMTGNQSDLFGGAVYQAGGGISTFINDTFYDNQCPYDAVSTSYGGAIFNYGNMALEGCTIVNNSSGGQYGGGGGIDNMGTCTIVNTIIAQNEYESSGTVSTADAMGTFDSFGYNLIGVVTGSDGWTSADLTGTAATPLSPGLDAPADNGGPTETALPAAGSPVIAAGSLSFIPSGVITDQRGYSRTYNDTVDIGAVEEESNSAPTPPGQLAFVPEPHDTLTGDTETITVDIENSGGTLTTGDTSTVTLAIGTAPTGGTLSGTLTEQASAGVATFTVSFSTAGMYTLTASDGTLTPATSSSFDISASSGGSVGAGGGGGSVGTSTLPVALVFAQQPTDVAADVTMSPPLAVDIVASNGAVVSTDDSDVTLIIASGPAGATINGYTVVQASNGVAMFSNLSFDEDGVYTLKAEDGSLSPRTSTSFTIGTGNTGGQSGPAPALLAFAQQPASSTIGSALAPVTVDVENSEGSIDTSDNSNVTLSIGFGPIGSSLGGSITAQAFNGVATFGNLSLNEVGNYALSAADGSLTPATSDLFAIWTAPTVTSNPTSQTLTAGRLATFIASAAGNPEPTAQWQVSIDGGTSFSDITGATSPSYTFTASAGQSGYQYRAVFTNPAGSVTTTAAALSVPEVSSGPNLAIGIGKVSLPASAVAGAKAKTKLQAIITNPGSTFSGAVEINLYANTSPTLDGNQVLLTATTKIYPSFKSHKSRTVKFKLRSFPATLPAGSYYLVAELVTPTGATSVAATTVHVQITSAIAQSLLHGAI